jgi:hypothetical protein
MAFSLQNKFKTSLPGKRPKTFQKFQIFPLFNTSMDLRATAAPGLLGSNAK